MYKKKEWRNAASMEEGSDISEDEVDKFHHSRDVILFNEDYLKTTNSSDDDTNPLKDQIEVLPLEYDQNENYDFSSDKDQFYQESDIKAWGRKKKIFYSVDKSTKDEELEECIRLQNLKRTSLISSDFYFPGILDPVAYYGSSLDGSIKISSIKYPCFKNGKLVKAREVLAVNLPMPCSANIPDTDFSNSKNKDEGSHEVLSCTEEDTSSHEQQSFEDSADEYYHEMLLKKEAKKYQSSRNYTDAEVDRYNDIPLGAKRGISYEILKNKGIVPLRAKEQRNPRVRQRKRYQQAMKRIRGFKPMLSEKFKGAPYKGEHSGIRLDIVKSTKFNY